MKILNYKTKNFYKELKKILDSRSQQNIENTDTIVKNIITQIKDRGDEALFKFVREFEGNSVNESNILISKKILKSYKDKIDVDVMNSFRISIKNTTAYHKKQKPKNYEILEDGVKTGSIWKPIQSVGLYVPAGKSVYPSSLIMNVVPAKIAGVKRIVVVTPNPSGNINPYILALLDELEVSEVYQVGGAQAIAALAYGTRTIKSVNKIFGPGNAYVTSAKKQVYGKVGIDLIAGPSEIIVVADNDNKPEWVATDLMAQAEHDDKAQSILITDSLEFSKKVLTSINNLINKLPKKDTIKNSLGNYGIIIILENLDDAASIIDFIAPEHLHLQNKNPDKILNNIHNVGGIFLGEYSPEAFGDYIVGTNHVLPTSGTAKFSSGLGVLDFMKRSSIVQMNSRGFDRLQKNVVDMTNVESLEGHKLSVKIRQTYKK